VALLLLCVAVLGGLIGAFLPRVVRAHGAVDLPVLLAVPVTAGAFALVTWRAVDLGRAPLIPALLVFTALGLALAAIDLAPHRLPNRLVLPAYPVLGALVAGAGLVEHDGWAIVRAALGAAALFGFFLLLALIHPAGMGMGDVKLAGVIGLVLGAFSWTALVLGGFVAFLLGAVVAVGVLVSGRGNRRTALPFGPFLVAGALAALWLAEPALALAVVG
jgi:leader peptidase (prepilin peptidase)/N-methyltransferase